MGDPLVLHCMWHFAVSACCQELETKRSEISDSRATLSQLQDSRGVTARQPNTLHKYSALHNCIDLHDSIVDVPSTVPFELVKLW